MFINIGKGSMPCEMIHAASAQWRRDRSTDILAVIVAERRKKKLLGF
jgi:hypothetical protein